MRYNSLFSPLSRTPFWLLSLLTLVAYSIFPLWFPLLPHAGQVPAADIRTFAATPAAGLTYALLLGWLFALYGLAAWRVQNHAPAPGKRQVWTTAVLFALPLLFTYPINATDVYRYFIRGRVSSVYGASPFAQPPISFPNDPFLGLAGEWVTATSPYGPLWETAAAGITHLAGDRLVLGLLLFKSLALALHLGVGLLLYRWVRDNRNGRSRRPAPVTVLLLWTWNPALLLTFVVNAHNDVMMLCWLLAGAWLMQRRPGTGFLVMVLAPLTKPIGLLPLPLFWLAAMRQQTPGRRRWRFAAITLAGSVVVTLLAFLPVGSPLDLGRRLLQEATAAGGFSPVTLLILGIQARQIPVTVTGIVRAGQLLFGIAALWLAWRVWHGRFARHRLHRAAAAIFLAYLCTAFSFRIWYAAWPYPWLLLGGNAQQRRWGHWFLCTTQFSVLIYGHLRVFALHEDYLLAHLLGVPFTFALPLLLTQIADKPAE